MVSNVGRKMPSTSADFFAKLKGIVIQNEIYRLRLLNIANATTVVKPIPAPVAEQDRNHQP